MRVRGTRSGIAAPNTRATRYGLPRKPESEIASKFALAIQRGVRICVDAEAVLPVLGAVEEADVPFCPTLSDSAREAER